MLQLIMSNESPCNQHFPFYYLLWVQNYFSWPTSSTSLNVLSLFSYNRNYDRILLPHNYPKVVSDLHQDHQKVIFTESANWANSVIESQCLSLCGSVCPRHRQEPTPQCYGELWMKNVFIIWAYDHNIFQKKCLFFLKFVKITVLDPHKKNTFQCWGELWP